MKKSILSLGNILRKDEQKQITGGMINRKQSPCCDPANDCCIQNPAYNGNNCLFIPGNPHAFPVPECI